MSLTNIRRCHELTLNSILVTAAVHLLTQSSKLSSNKNVRSLNSTDMSTILRQHTGMHVYACEWVGSSWFDKGICIELSRLQGPSVVQARLLMVRSYELIEDEMRNQTAADEEAA